MSYNPKKRMFFSKSQLYRYSKKVQSDAVSGSRSEFLKLLNREETESPYAEKKNNRENMMQLGEDSPINEILQLDRGLHKFFLRSSEEVQAEPLYPKATISRNDAIGLVMDFNRRFKLSNVAFGGVLTLLDQLLPVGHLMPTSNYKFDKILGVSDIVITEQHFCREHRVYVGRASEKPLCMACREGTEFTSATERFLTFDIVEIWERLLVDPTVQRLIKAGENRNTLGIKKSPRYMELPVQKNDTTISLFMDAMKLSKSGTSSSVTVVSLVCNEIPVKYRYSFARPVMIYVGEKKVDASILLEPLITQLLKMSAVRQQSLCENTPRAHLIICVSDAVAKCDIQGFRQFNASEYSCTNCLVSGEAREHGHGPTVFPYEHGKDSARRTHEETLRDASEALDLLDSAQPLKEKEKGIHGVKSVSQLLRFPKAFFDIIRSCPSDIMHVVMGVGNQLLEILLTNDLSELPFYDLYKASKDYDAKRNRLITAKEMDIIGSAMSVIRFPAHVNRMPRHLCYWTVYKATEYLHLFMYVFPFLFRQKDMVISRMFDEKLRHLLLCFSNALHLLLADQYQEGITTASETIARRGKQAEILLKDFLHLATCYFGQSKMTYNFHSLIHLADAYKDHGPLYEVSAFPHESNLGLLKSMIHGTNPNHLDKEICNKFVRRILISQQLIKHSADKIPIRMTGRSRGVGVMNTECNQAVVCLLQRNGISEDSQHAIDVYKRGYLNTGFFVETVSQAANHEIARTNAVYLLNNGSIAEILHLVVVTSDYKTCMAVCNVVGIKEPPKRWKSKGTGASASFDLEYPLFYIRKPLSSHKIVAIDVCSLVMPILLLDKTEEAVRYLVPTLHMPRS